MGKMSYQMRVPANKRISDLRSGASPTPRKLSTRRGWSEAGEGRLAFFFWLVLFAVIVAAAFQGIPARISVDRYQDFLLETAERKYNVGKVRIKKGVLARAQELKLPVTEDDIEVSVTSKRIRIYVEYTVPINFLVYTYEWHKVHNIDREIFRF